MPNTAARLRPLAPAVAIVVALLAGACGNDSPEPSAGAAEPGTDAAAPADAAAGIRVVTPAEAAEIQATAPEGLVVLDVRTPEEFAEGHLEGATMLDFYAPDFGARLGELDREVPYLLICRSGNRSSQVRAMMTDLGFTDVADVEGGIVAWTGAGLPLAP